MPRALHWLNTRIGFSVHDSRKGCRKRHTFAMHNYDQRLPYRQPTNQQAASFVVGERVRIIHAPTSYGYNGRTGRIAEIAGSSIQVLVDEHPVDMHCTTFYAEELEREAPPQETNNSLE